MSKQCKNCGTDLPEDASFCPRCAQSQIERRAIKPPRLWRKKALITAGCALVLAAAVLGLWRYGVQRRQRRTLVWALAAAIGEMESAIRWQQTPMMALLEGLAARETVGQYFHETADMVQGGITLQCAWEKAFSAIQDGEAGEILARLRLGGDRERLVGALGQTRQELEELYRRRCREDGQRSRVTTAAALCGAGLVIILLI